MRKIIPQEQTADCNVLADNLREIINIRYPQQTRVFLFGSWASHKKSFTDGDVDIFVGIQDYDYDTSESLATIHIQTIDIHTVDEKIYENRPIELHWGGSEDFLSETEPWERKELTERLIHQ